MKATLSFLWEFFKRDTVFCVATLAAVLSMFWITPTSAYLSYIDYRVLSLLFCLMLVVAGLSSIGVFDKLASWLLRYVRTTRQLAGLLILICFFLSMWITNDVALITFVPFAILVLHRANRDKLLIPVIVMQTIAANLGSMCTPIGNPQNLYLFTASHISIGGFFAVMLPLSVASLLLILLSLIYFPSENLANDKAAANASTNSTVSTSAFHPQPAKLVIYLALLFLCLLTVFHVLDYRITLFLTIVILLLVERHLFFHTDYMLLLTFVSFFVFVGNIRQIPVIDSFLQQIVSHRPISVSIVASQVISNVPAAVLLSGFTTDWNSLLIGTNLGGLGTLIASMASLISYKYYCATTDCNPRRYLVTFTLVNILFLASMTAISAFIPS